MTADRPWEMRVECYRANQVTALSAAAVLDMIILAEYIKKLLSIYCETLVGNYLLLLFVIGKVDQKWTTLEWKEQ